MNRIPSGRRYRMFWELIIFACQNDGMWLFLLKCFVVESGHSITDHKDIFVLAHASVKRVVRVWFIGSSFERNTDSSKVDTT